jgi:hypothetical protein
MSLHGGTLGKSAFHLTGQMIVDLSASRRQRHSSVQFLALGRPMLQSLIRPTREEALQEAPGKPVVMIRPAPVRVRSVLGNAIAYTVTHVLVEWDAEDRHHLRWEASWLVHRVPQDAD